MDIGSTGSKAEDSSSTESSVAFLYCDRGLAAVENALNIIGASFIIVVMVFTSCEILGRYLFNTPIPGYVENVEMMMAAIAFLGVGYNQRTGGHVRMDLLVKRLARRPYHLAEALLLTFSLAVCGLICIYSFKSAVHAFRVGDVTEYLYFPTWPSKMCVPVGVFFLCTRFVLQIIRSVAQAMARTERKTRRR